MTKYVKVAAAVAVVGMLAVAGPAMAASGDTLKIVKERGALLCTGHNGSFLGFAEVDDKGAWKGLDIELCRGLTAAIFGNVDALKIIPLSWAQRFPSLQSGDVDVVIKASGGTFSRDTELGLQFSRAYFLGTTKVMVRKELGLTKLSEADGGSICIPAGTTIERQVVAYTQRIGMSFEAITFEKSEEIREAYFSNRCDVYAQWGPTLAIARSVSDDPDAHEILPDILAMEPEVAIMRSGDDNWIDVVNWVFSALWYAEQEGITAANVEKLKASPPSQAIGKLLGATPGIGTPLGLSDDWAYNVIKNVGNYGEIYSRSMGDGSVYKMPRGMNRLWNDGGLLYPMVFD